jgi:hypothetical protein
MPNYDVKIVAQVHYRTMVQADSKDDAKEIIIQMLDDLIDDDIEIRINWTQIYSERPDSEEDTDD